MALSTIIYTGEWTDDAGNDCTVYIHKVGYNGESATLTMGSVPVVIQTIGDNDNKFQHIVPTEAYINVVSNSFLQFVDFFTSPQKTYYIEIYRGIALIWTGWVNPEYYTEAFVTYPHEVSIHAVDGLSELKNIPFPIPGYTSSDYQQNAIYYIAKCLYQTGLGLTSGRYIMTAINLCAEKYDGTLISTRILEHIYFDYRSFQDDDGVFQSCWEVLNEILSALGARCYTDAYYWRIHRVDHRWENHTLEAYTLAGVYFNSYADQSAAISLTANLGWGSTMRFEHPASLEIQPAAKQFIIEHDYGMRPNLLHGTSYKLFGDNDFNAGAARFWTANGSIEHTKDDDIENCLRIKDIYYAGTDYLQSDNVNVEEMGVGNLSNLFNGWVAGRVSLIFSFEVGKRFAAKESSKNFVANLKLYANFSGTAYYGSNEADSNYTLLGQDSPGKGLSVKSVYNDSKGAFTPVADLDSISIDIADSDDFMSVALEFNAPPDAELGNSQTYLIFGVILYACACNLDPADVEDTDGLLFRNMRLYFRENYAEKFEREIVTVCDTDNILEPEAYPVKFGNAPDPSNSNAWGVLTRHVIFDADGEVIRNWGYRPDTMPVSDLTSFIIMNDLFTTYRRPVYLLRGNLLNSLFTENDAYGYLLDKVLQDYDSRYYMPLMVRYDMRSCFVDSAWLCIRDDSGTGEFNDDFSDDFFI